DDRVDVLQRALESEQDVFAFAGFAQQVIRTAANYIDAVLDEALDRVDQAQLARLAVDDCQQDHAEAGLKLRLLIKIVQDNFGLLVAFQLEDNAHAFAIAFVANFGNAFDLFLIDQGGSMLDELGLVDLVGDFGDDNRFAILADFFGGSFRA